MKRQWIAGVMALALGVGAFTGCAQQEQEQQEQDAFELQVLLPEAPVQLDPVQATSVTEQTVLMNLNDNLMALETASDGTVEVVGALAKSVETTDNEDGTTTYTFTLRTAKWSDGQAVKAEDFVYAWKRLADPAVQSPYGTMLSMVVGYGEYASGVAAALAVSAPDSQTFQVTVAHSNDWFLSQVCTAVATLPVRQDVVLGGDDWATDFEALPTCGSYMVEAEGPTGLTLSANETYYGKAPNAQTVVISFEDNATQAYEAFTQGEVDFIWPLSQETYSQLQAQAQESERTFTSVAPLLVTTYVAINNQDEILLDPLVRQALSASVNHGDVADSLGAYAQVALGLVPFGVDGTQGDEFRDEGVTVESGEDTYDDRQRQAQAALAGSTYPVDNQDYALTLLCTQEQSALAQLLCDQWQQALSITVTPEVMDSFNVQQAMMTGAYQLALSQMDPQINDAQPYLSCWTSSSVNNVVGYSDTAFDTLLAVVLAAVDSSGRVGCLHDAEALLVEDCAVIPLYTMNTAWLLDETMVGVSRDSRGWFTFGTVTQLG